MKKTLICIVLLCSSNSVLAQWITIGITAQVNSVADGGGLEGKIHTGDTITGTYTYDSTVLDVQSSPIWGHYDNRVSPAGIRLECGGFVFKTNPNNVYFSLEVENGTAGVNNWLDGYSLQSTTNSSLSNGSPLNIITWILTYSSQDVLSSDALPITAPNLSSGIHDNSLCIDSMRGSNFRIYATVTSATLVPEPATVCLLAVGGVLLGRKRK
jgi:hypothetical protein